MTTRRPKVRYLREVWMRVKDPALVAKARKRKNYTQYDLAALAKCTQAAISALETGTMRGCSKDLAEAIAKWVDRDVEELFEAHEGSRVQRVTNAAGSTRRKSAVAA